MKLSLAATLVFVASFASAEVPSLTPDNYDELTGGKTVFIKFFAPWCGHCKKMAPDWEKLSGEWTESDTGLIAEVDCTADGKALCEANGVRGYPSLKYGDPSALEDYQGGRTYDDLAKFAKENLKPVCSPTNLDLCDDEKKAEIQKFMEIPKEKLGEMIKEEEEKMESAEKEFQEQVEKLQESYKSLMEAKDAKIEAIKAAGLGIMKSVKSFLEKQATGSDEL